MLVIPTARDHPRRWEHLGIGDAQGGIRRVDCRTKHGNALLNQRLFSLILRLLPRSVILKSPVVVLKSLKSRGFKAFRRDFYPLGWEKNH
jgi:hypothetical protein